MDLGRERTQAVPSAHVGAQEGEFERSRLSAQAANPKGYAIAGYGSHRLD
jgi:hypothetical protein